MLFVPENHYILHNLDICHVLIHVFGFFGINKDCAAPNCNIEAVGLLKESIKQPSNNNTYLCVSWARDRPASDLSLSPHSLAGTLILSSRAEGIDVEPRLQDLRSKYATSRLSDSQT